MSKDCYYNNSDARGGKPTAQAAQNASLSKFDRDSKHLTQPSGGAKSVGDQGPHEKTRPMKNNIGAAKKIAGGSNY